ncbi:hypothetical protein M8J77_011551 [Diaphorina citri]|nr:hypothetical protein M8J77_011551 [Diaphorina citri]
MSRNKSNQTIVDFIGIFRSEPCLWKNKSEEYKNRDLKNAALKKLAEKLSEVESDATVKSALAKINSLRSAYNKERKKYEQSIIHHEY